MVSFALMFILFLAGIPVAFAIGLTPIPFIPNGLSLLIPQKMISGVDSFVLLAVPFFILAGELMNVGGITDKIFDFARSLVGHIRGGLGHVNVLGSMIFSGMTGSAVADAAGLGSVEIKAMKDAQYDDGFTAAVTAASSVIGPIIPPSVPFVIYGSLVGISVGRLLIAGAIPGVITGLAQMILIYIMAGKRNFPLDPRPSLKKMLRTFLRALPPMVTPVILIGGIMIGIFTPTEAGAVAALYALFLTFIIYREVKSKELIAMLIRVVSRIGSFLLIVSTSALYANILARLEIPQFIVEKLSSISSDPIILLLIINIFLLIVGCVMEALAALTILAPILSSICGIIGIDPVHFGVIVVFSLMIGAITPPVGVCMFIVNKITNISTLCFIKNIWPFFICLVVVLFMITYIPGLSLFLPNLFMGK